MGNQPKGIQYHHPYFNNCLVLDDPKRLQIDLDGIAITNYNNWKLCLENIKNIDFKGILIPIKQ